MTNGSSARGGRTHEGGGLGAGERGRGAMPAEVPLGEESRQWPVVEIRITLAASRTAEPPVLEWLTVDSVYSSCTD